MTDSGAAPRRGRLTVYLGAAPGVGKTYAMLDEAHRRCSRGTDVVVGYVETHDRPNTAGKVDGLEVLPRRTMSYRGSTFTELDVDAVLARRPAVVCVDELAHTNIPGSRHEKRSADIQQILDAGIDVITTVNIQHLESLNDEVERITGVRQRETVPDEVVRTAAQIQLVDMPPDALRRRMAHGNIYKPEKIDASLTSFFRVGNLTALRELALLWLADRVDDALGDYRRAHQISHPWPTKERIVVAVTGGPESEALLRRGARLAQRAAGSDLLAVHVVTDDGLARSGGRTLASMQALTSSLGGTFHSIVGDDVSAAVVDFAVATNATMVVVGVSTHGRLTRMFSGTTGDRVAASAGSIDVHLVPHEGVAPVLRKRRASALNWRRTLVGWMLAIALPVGMSWWLQHGEADPSTQLPVAGQMLLAGTVLVALIGGLWPAILAAGVSFLSLNWWFSPPLRRFTISDPRDITALTIFSLVAIGVATVVDRAARRAEDAVRARTEAATMTALSRSVLTGQDTADAVVQRVRETFGQQAAVLLRRKDSGWERVSGAGVGMPDRPHPGDTQVEVDGDHILALRGPHLRAGDQRVLEAFAVHVSLVLEYRRLREHADRATALERAEAMTTALLRAVSHDLRTPLATMRASVDGLAVPVVSEEDRAVLVGAAKESTRQLEQLIDNLLDLSRLEAGLLRPTLVPLSLDEILPRAIAGHGTVSLDVDEDVPLVLCDPGLLERVIANLVSNAVRVSHGGRVALQANVVPGRVEVLVVDHGPGISPDLREKMFEPFQRLDDTSPGGLGLGLAVARGLSEAMAVGLSAEETPGGGLTMVVSVPQAETGGAR
ncbi:sensor histidine kinase [Nocardioides baekrokdamisoli]|uniref:sensor histidine kinase n=1 Tax=Nocardioides baekrokdamisoli TaxID=1804624 RepID=UPI000F78CF9D|nr:sensor histidine kinase KdpD [Nocardioides baekrokdamisoli]